MLRLVSGIVALYVLLSKNTSAFNNDATEPGVSQLLPDSPEKVNDRDTNQASNSGRLLTEAVRNGPDQSQVGCRELRSTKYISDGQCTSVNPIKELVCAGECLPTHLLPNWIGGEGYTGRYWSRRNTQEWRCVIDQARTQRIWLQCKDGSSWSYKITVVTSCRCKRYSREQNNSGHKDTLVHTGKFRKHHRKGGTSSEKTRETV